MMASTVTIDVPITFRQRGGRKLVVAPDGSALPAIASRSKIDNVLVKALARAFRWQKLLDNGTYRTIKEIATDERIDKGYVSDVLRLSLLAPDIIDMILDGRQPPGLQFDRLRGSLPVQWQRQHEMLRSVCWPGAEM